MILITVNEWLGPGREYPKNAIRQEPTNKLTCFASRLGIVDALDEIYRYQLDFNKRHLLAVNFSLISFQACEEIPEKLLDNLGVQMVEDLIRHNDGENDHN